MARQVNFMPKRPQTAETPPAPGVRFAQQLKKGALEMLVLQLLAAQPSHGYGLIQRLRAGSGGRLDLKEGTLYPILYRLEDDGCITSAWRDIAKDGARRTPRKVYTVTAAGLAVLAEEKAAWRDFSACVNIICKEDAP